MRLALGAAGRPEVCGARWLLGAGADAPLRATAESTSAGDGDAGLGAAATGASVSPGEACAPALGAPSFTATDTRPSNNPAAAAATIVQRDPIGRRERGPADDSSVLVTKGASLSGARLEGTLLGGGRESTFGAGTLGSSAATFGAGGVGVGIARNVIFSLAGSGAGSLTGGGGGKLERRSGMCSDSGASPPRTTTA